MRAKKYTETQIAEIIAMAARGSSISTICSEYSISKQTFYRWKAEASKANMTLTKSSAELEAENAILKEALADAVIEVRLLQRSKRSTSVTIG